MPVKRDYKIEAPDNNPKVADKFDPDNLFFGTGGDINEPDPDYEPPEQVQEICEVLGETKKTFYLQLAELPDDSTSTNLQNLCSMKNKIPTIEWITKNYGPGNYHLIFNYRVTDPETGKSKREVKRVEFTVSQKCLDDYEEYQLQKRMRRFAKQRDEMRNAKMRKELESGFFDNGEGAGKELVDPKSAAKDWIRTISEDAKLLGFSKAGNGGMDFEGVLKIALPLLPGILQGFSQMAESRRAEQMQLMTLMLSNMGSNNKEMLEILKSTKQPQDGSDYFSKVGDMLFQALDLKEKLSGEKISVVDKVFSAIEKALPVIGAFAMMPKAARENNPLYKAVGQQVQEDANFQQVLTDPAMFAEVVKRLDDHYGADQTDNVLSVAGITIPPDIQQVRQQQQQQQQQGETGDNEQSTGSETGGDENPLSAAMG